jgi:DNA helicase-2/ATP-dependent DNA helicase PcrA
MSVIRFLKQEKGIALNSQQQEAVNTVHGPILLLAVPGSGKTTVLIARIRAMINEHGIAPSSILNLSFSTESAKDMSLRYLDLFSEADLEALNFRTVHSLCYKVIKDYERFKNRKAFEVLDQNTPVIRRILMERYSEYPAEDTVFNMVQMIGYCKNMLMKADALEKTEVPGCDFYPVYQAYEHYKLQQKMMDYDDLLIYALRILNAHPKILGNYHQAFRYINVDEAQDISYVQHEIIRLLAARHENIFMVGDEDQSIYGFRAAYPKALMDFGNHYEKAVILKMEQNFRSTKVITQSANNLIGENHQRYEKNMFSTNEVGRELVETHFCDAYGQYDYIAKGLKRITSEQTTAVLYRNNDSMIPLYDALDREGVAVSFRQGQLSFFSHVIVRDVLCFISLSQRPDDFEAFERIYYKIKCGITKDLISQLIGMPHQNVFKAFLSLPFLKDGMKKKVTQVMDKVSHLNRLKPLKAIECIEKDLGYGDYVKKLGAEGYTAASLNQKLNGLKSIAKGCHNLQEFVERMAYLEKSCLSKPRSHKNAVVLSTIHSSKGLEFDKVILMDIFEGLLPSKESVTQLKLGKRELYEEEVRLFYVALTRAKSIVEVITADTQNGQGITVSRFIDLAIPSRKPKASTKGKTQGGFSLLAQPKSKVHKKRVVKEEQLVAFRVGSRVKHKVFGFGHVDAVNREKLSVWFDSELKEIDLVICLENGILELVL